MVRGATHKARIVIALMAAMLCAIATGRVLQAQQVVDRIIARVEGNVLLLSEERELGQFQQLLGGESQPETKRFDELIDQWVIEHEAQAALFSQPSDADVNAEVKRLQEDLGGAQAYQKRADELGLSSAAVARQVRRELFFNRYLEYKFRPAAQVDEAAEQKYYDTEFVPQMTARGQKAPQIDSVRSQIHELLVEKDVSARADQWLTESRGRLKIEVVPPMAPTSNPAGKQ